MKKNNIESEIDAIRDKIWEQTKHMTATERTDWFNERGQKLAAQYGFKIDAPHKEPESAASHPL
jgi:hypothetical protein